ncbi:hypothetical protein, partial [Pseudomonas aeruginosa]
LWNMFGALWLLPARARFMINPAKLQARQGSVLAH